MFTGNLYDVAVCFICVLLYVLFCVPEQIIILSILVWSVFSGCFVWCNYLFLISLLTTFNTLHYAICACLLELLLHSEMFLFSIFFVNVALDFTWDLYDLLLQLSFWILILHCTWDFFGQCETKEKQQYQAIINMGLF